MKPVDLPVTYPNDGKCPAYGCQGRLTHGLYHHYFCTHCKRHFIVDESAVVDPGYVLIRATHNQGVYKVRLDREAPDHWYRKQPGEDTTDAEKNALRARGVAMKYKDVMSDEEFYCLINACGDVDYLQTLLNEFVNDDIARSM